MVVHFGIYQSCISQTIYVSSYDSCSKETNIKIFDIVDHEEIEFVGVIFEDIVSAVPNKKLGYACIYFEKCFNNNFYKDCIEMGKCFGFMGIEILSFYANTFLQAIVNTNYIPQINDYIWLPGLNGGYAWQRNGSGKFELEHWLPWNAEKEMNIMKNTIELFKNPNAIFFASDVDIDVNEARKFFPTSRIYFCLSNPDVDVPLVKARIMAVEKDVMNYDVANALNEEIKIWYGGNEIMKFSEFLQLPCENSVKVVKAPNENVIKLQNRYFSEDVQPPPFKRFMLTVNFDVNGIYTFSFKELPPLSKIDAKIELLYSKLASKAIAELGPLNFNKTYSIPTNIDLNDNSINAIGIDLGTLHCCAAVDRRNGMATVVLDNSEERLLPAFVGFDEKHEKCGAVVVNRLRNHANTTVFDLKQIIGKEFKEIATNKLWPFHIVQAENNCARIQIVKENEQVTKYPEEVLAVLVKQIKQKVEEFQGKEIGRAVLAVPQNFNEKQRNATFISALLAGWKSVHLLPEPIAAAFAYFTDKTLSPSSNILVVDLGAGSFDISVLKMSKNGFFVHKNCSNLELIGNEFDNILCKYFEHKFLTDFGIEINETKKHKLMMECEKIKKSLSFLNEAWLEVEKFDILSEEIIPITRTQFEEMCFPLLQKIKETIFSTLQDKDITQIKKVIYVGGGSRMPMFKELLKNMLPHADHWCHIHPEEVIAIGATYYAYYLNSSTRNLIAATTSASLVYDILKMLRKEPNSMKNIFEQK